MTDAVVVLVSAGSEAEALGIARALIMKKLAACCTLVKDVHAVYRWEGAVEESREVQLVIKSRRDAFPALEAEVRRLHSYTTPEIIALPVLAGSDAYLKWINTSML